MVIIDAHVAGVAYQAIPAQSGVAVSMSRDADCDDNALAESFTVTRKTELIAIHGERGALPSMASSTGSSGSTTADDCARPSVPRARPTSRWA